MTITFLEHTADIKFKVVGDSKKKVFEESVRAFSHYLTGGKRVKKEQKKNITIEATDTGELLYKLLDELIYFVDAESFIASSAKVSFTSKGITALIEGDRTDRYEISQVKAATYAEMYVKKKGSNWEAQVVLDV